MNTTCEAETDTQPLDCLTDLNGDWGPVLITALGVRIAQGTSFLPPSFFLVARFSTLLPSSQDEAQSSSAMVALFCTPIGTHFIASKVVSTLCVSGRRCIASRCATSDNFHGCPRRTTQTKTSIPARVRVQLTQEWSQASLAFLQASRPPPSLTGVACLCASVSTTNGTDPRPTFLWVVSSASCLSGMLHTSPNWIVIRGFIPSDLMVSVRSGNHGWVF